MHYKLGVDGGGTKTECILVDSTGQIVARQVSPGCNPSVVGAGSAASILNSALVSLRALGIAQQPRTPPSGAPAPATQETVTRRSDSTRALPRHDQLIITDTLLCMAGSRGFWTDFAASLADCGRVTALDDSRPILELATHGRAGLALHAGTGSFVAARGPDQSVHYAGGFGWRFGDPASGYDLGARAIGRAILELQGWAAPSGLTAAVLAHAQLRPQAGPGDVTSYFYSHADASRHIAALAPAILQLAHDRDAAAREIVVTSTSGLLDLAINVARQLFSAAQLDTVPVGLSGPILNDPFVLETLSARSPMPLVAITGAPIEGVRQLLTHL